MMMQKPSNVQFRAFLLTLLIFGCEAARVKQDVDIFGKFKQDVSQAHGSLFQSGTHSPVCDAKYNNDDSVERYMHKQAKITELSKKIFNASCIASCGLWLSELKKRVIEFRPCFAVARGAPSELQSILAGFGTTSLFWTLRQVMDDMVAVFKSKGYFKAKGACAFDVGGLNVTRALFSADDAMNTLRHQMFGKDCDKTQQVAYLASLPKNERQVVLDCMSRMEEILQIHQHAKDSDESIAEEGTELDRVIDEASSALSPSVDGHVGALLEGDAEGSAMAMFIIWIFFIGLIVTAIVAVIAVPAR